MRERVRRERTLVRQRAARAKAAKAGVRRREKECGANVHERNHGNECEQTCALRASAARDQAVAGQARLSVRARDDGRQVPEAAERRAAQPCACARGRPPARRAPAHRCDVARSSRAQPYAAAKTSATRGFARTSQTYCACAHPQCWCSPPCAGSSAKVGLGRGAPHGRRERARERLDGRPRAVAHRRARRRVEAP